MRKILALIVSFEHGDAIEDHASHSSRIGDGHFRGDVRPRVAAVKIDVFNAERVHHAPT